MKITTNIYRYLLLTTSFFLVIQVSADQSELIYDDYIFLPAYTDQNKEANSASAVIFEKNYSNYWLTTSIKNSIVLDGKIFSIGFVEMKKNKRTEFTMKKLDIQKQERKLQKKSFNNLFSQVNHVGDNMLVSVHGDVLTELAHEKRNHKFYSNGHGAYDYLYCVEDKPLFNASLLLNKPFVFHVTAQGDENLSGGGFDAVRLYIYSRNGNKNILYTPLFLANYQANKRRKQQDDIYYFSQYTESHKHYPELFMQKEQEGRKRYAKLFIKDFDKNNKLDIVVWHREYASARRDDKNKKGFYLDKQWFEWYEENINSDALVKRKLTTKNGHRLLKDNKLWWIDGWPNQNLCQGGFKDLSYMPFIEDPEINEPMGKTVEFGY